MKILDIIEHKTTITYKQNVFEAKTPGLGDGFELGQIFPLDGPGGKKWGVGLGSNVNDVLEFITDKDQDGQKAARAFVADSKNAAELTKVPPNINALKKRVENFGGKVRSLGGVFKTLSRRAAQSSVNDYQAVQNISQKNRTLKIILNSKMWSGFFRIAAAVGLPYAAITNAINIINDLENEAENSQNPQELYELRNIVIGQMSIQILIYLVAILRNAQYIKRALGPLKWTIRAAQGATATTGVGLIPAALSFLVSEAAFLVVGWILTSESVQRGIAEWLQGTLMGEITGILGSGVVAATQMLDNAFDGAYGTAEMRRSLGWDPDSEGAPDGEMTSSSEWAKLVFHGLLFPPGAKKYLVPYIAPQQRITLLQSTMGISQQSAPPGPAPGANPNTSSEPGLPVDPNAQPGPQ